MAAVIELVPGDQGKRGQCCRKLRFVEEKEKHGEKKAIREAKFKQEERVSAWTSGRHVTARVMKGKSWLTNPESLL